MNIKKGYVDTSGGQIHFAHTNGIGIPIVCFHQTASSCRSYYPLMDNEVIQNSMYAFDTPGFGNSFDPDGMPKFEQYAEWLIEAIHALGIKKCHLLGHHTGAAICVEFAASYSKEVESMILIGPFPLSESEREEFRPHFSTPIEPNKDGSYLIKTWEYLTELGADKDLKNHHDELLDHVRAYYSRYQTYSAVWDYDFTAQYKSSSCPTLLMAAPDDVLYPYLERSKILKPDAELIEISGANYELALDSQNVCLEINRFLGTSK